MTNKQDTYRLLHLIAQCLYAPSVHTSPALCTELLKHIIPLIRKDTTLSLRPFQVQLSLTLVTAYHMHEVPPIGTVGVTDPYTVDVGAAYCNTPYTTNNHIVKVEFCHPLGITTSLAEWLCGHRFGWSKFYKFVSI